MAPSFARPRVVGASSPLSPSARAAPPGAAVASRHAPLRAGPDRLDTVARVPDVRVRRGVERQRFRAAMSTPAAVGGGELSGSGEGSVPARAPRGAGPLLVVVAGVSGSGKSTVGALLAARLGAPFLEGDDYHPPSNRAKMASGRPLDDADRFPWLRALGGAAGERAREEGAAVVACSALARRYRAALLDAAGVGEAWEWTGVEGGGGAEGVRERVTAGEVGGSGGGGAALLDPGVAVIASRANAGATSPALVPGAADAASPAPAPGAADAASPAPAPGAADAASPAPAPGASIAAPPALAPPPAPFSSPSGLPLRAAIVELAPSEGELSLRLQRRESSGTHFMPASLLASQLQTRERISAQEEGEDRARGVELVLRCDAEPFPSPQEIVEEIARDLQALHWGERQARAAERGSEVWEGV